MLLWGLYGARNDGMTAAGKPQLWKQRARSRQGLGMYSVPLPKTKQIKS
jgi:hypothetical protein